MKESRGARRAEQSNEGSSSALGSLLSPMRGPRPPQSTASQGTWGLLARVTQAPPGTARGGQRPAALVGGGGGWRAGVTFLYLSAWGRRALPHPLKSAWPVLSPGAGWEVPGIRQPQARKASRLCPQLCPVPAVAASVCGHRSMGAPALPGGGTLGTPRAGPCARSTCQRRPSPGRTQPHLRVTTSSVA